ncbi:MAG: mechanosensitive ion channel family protein [Mucilaginibacter polytrichastri]|nr:mechanosensitive ion channel family protein [Mucilaginibacter polytrichastri]
MMKQPLDKFSVWVDNHGLDILGALVFLIAGFWLISFLNRAMKKSLARRKVHNSLQSFLQSLISTTLYILLVMVVLQVAGLPLTLFTTLVGALGVAAGLALSGTLQNFAGGVLILLLKPFELDDHIIAQGQEGRVSTIQVFYTAIITFDGRTVIIPNGKLFNEVITNVSRRGMRRLHVDFKLLFSADIAPTIADLQSALRKQDYLLPEPAADVSILKLEDNGVRIQVRGWVLTTKFDASRMKLNEFVTNHLKNSGVSLPA